MPGRYTQLRWEMQANFELTWAGQAEGNRRLGEMASKLEDQATKIEAQGRLIAEQARAIGENGRQIGVALRETARIGREVVAHGDQMVGRFRQMDERFGKFLDVLESESDQHTDAINDLRGRVSKLENQQGPAA